MMNEGRKRLNEGPGAGYTLSGIINLDKVQAIRKVTVERETAPYSWNTHNIFLDCIITGTTEDLEAQSYFYGKGIGEAPVEVTMVELAVHIPEDEDPNEFAKEHMDEIEEGLAGLAVKIEYVYGGGYVHSKFDGTISEVDNAVSDSDSYDGDISFELWALDARITDEAIVDYIDKAVTGDTSIEVYSVIDEDGSPVDEFSEEEDAIKFAKENGYPEVRRDIYELLINGDEDFADSETVWEEGMEESLQSKTKKPHGHQIREGLYDAGGTSCTVTIDGVKSITKWRCAKDVDDGVGTHKLTLIGSLTGTARGINVYSEWYGDTSVDVDVPVEINRVQIILDVPTGINPDEFVNKHRDVITNGLIGLSLEVTTPAKSFDSMTFDGVISRAEDGALEIDNYIDEIEFTLWGMDARITDAATIEYIAKALTGDLIYPMYNVVSDDETECSDEDFFDMDTAIDFAKNNGLSKVLEQSYQTTVHGDDVPVGDPSVVWEASIEESIRKHGKEIFESSGKKKISLYVNGEYVCSSHQYSRARDFVDAVKREGKISYYGLKGTGIGMVTKTIQDSDKVTARLDESYLTESLGRYADTDMQEASLDVIERLASEVGIKLRFGTKVGKYPQSVVLDYRYQDGAVYIGRNGHIDIQGKEFGSYQDDEFYADECEDELMDALIALKNSDAE